MFQQADVFEKARTLVEEHRADAERVAENLSPEALRRLAHHLIQAVLEPPAATPTVRRPLAVPAR